MNIIFGLLMAGLLLGAGLAQAETRDLGQIVLTPNRDAVSAAHASSNVTVIGHNMIEQSNARNIAQVLQRAGGVNVYALGSGKSTVVDIGGYADTAVSNVLVLVNGRRTNTVDMTGPDWLQIPLETVERIEVIRGGASVLYGDKASAGVVNIITKEGAQKSTVFLFSEFGSYNYKKSGVEASGAKDKLFYYLYSDYADKNGYRANSQILSRDANGRVGYTINDLVKVGLEGGWHRDDYGLSGALTGEKIDSLGRRGTTTPNDYGDTNDSFARLSGELIPVDIDARFGKIAMDYSHRSRNTYAMSGSTATWNGFFAQKGKIESDGVLVKHVWSGNLAGRALNMVTGVDFYDDRNHILTNSDAGDGDDLVILKESLGEYNHTEYEVLDHFFVDGGVRHEAARYTFKQFNYPSKSAQTAREDAYSGGLKYEYASGSNIFFNAQKTFRFLASDEWYQSYYNPPYNIPGLNTDLKQQTGREYQLGIKHNLNDTLVLTATPKLSMNANEIYYDANRGINTNYDRTRRLGVDFGAALDVQNIIKASCLSRWDVFINYSHIKAQFDGGDYDQKVIPVVPARLWLIGMDIALKKGLSWDLTGRYIGEQRQSNDLNNEHPWVKPYIVVDTKVSYKINTSLDVYVGVNNVLNEKYSSYVIWNWDGQSYYYPAPERNYLAGMKCRF